MNQNSAQNMQRGFAKRDSQGQLQLTIGKVTPGDYTGAYRYQTNNSKIKHLNNEVSPYSNHSNIINNKKKDRQFQTLTQGNNTIRLSGSLPQLGKKMSKNDNHQMPPPSNVASAQTFQRQMITEGSLDKIPLKKNKIEVL